MRNKSDNSSQNTLNNGRTSKRKIKLPNRYKDTDCELNKNKNNDNRSLEAEQEEMLDNMGLTKNGVDKGKKEVSQSMVSEVDLTGKDFPTLDESIGKKGSPEKVVNVSTDAATAVSQSVCTQTPLDIGSVTDANKVCESRVDNNCDKADCDLTKVGKTFADTVKPNKIDVLNKLSWIPTVLNEARMCEEGTGNIGSARVLVEIRAAQEFKEKIELCYKSAEQKLNCANFVKVEYSWKPPRCNECKVYGHNCALKKEVNTTIVNGSDHVDKNDGNGNYKKNAFVGNKGGNKNVRKRQEFRPVNKQVQVSTSGVQDPGPSVQEVNRTTNTNASREHISPKHTSPKSPWKVSHSTMEEIKRSANKYAVLEELVDSDCPEEQIRNEKEI
ncbi:ATPase, F1/V1/A1 complex, alpha/beta subunit, Zinc knuckle CX2CX4HX4C [Artemisia annua]|uniref:ATPase, F1/V1/A1 complex, alpha/beta subunit, Zinc knuckle CX2CX4HX4C n=1 Tax=Artemisia annua TaxID=35608 RepID=A0A2U1PA43_ARTAN|nr:ATPase, F1/V1/A1 complex, alpha/beta subunit, Zinc knuckle CX2CX4HX4C [Artemisia annua]